MILVIDDHDDTLSLLLRLLQRQGYDATGATGGTAALLRLESLKPLLIVLDCHMPGTDGFGVLQRLRDDARLRDVPVVMFSAASQVDERRAMRLGARDFVRKGSLGWEQLMFAVRKHLLPLARLGA